MGFFRNWLKTASTLSALERDNLFLEREKVLAEGELEKERVKNALLTKAVEKARNSENLALRRIADGQFKLVKLPQHFVDDATVKEVIVEEPDEIEEARILEMAKQTRDADELEEGKGNVPEIEWYIDKVRKEGLDSLIIS